MHIDNFMASVKHLMPLPWLYQNITLTNSTQQPDTSKSAASKLIFQHSPVPLGASDVTAWCWKTLKENWSKRNMCPCFKDLSPPKSCVYCSNS